MRVYLTKVVFYHVLPLKNRVLLSPKIVFYIINHRPGQRGPWQLLPGSHATWKPRHGAVAPNGPKLRPQVRHGVSLGEIM